jgi:hypothetical protein
MRYRGVIIVQILAIVYTLFSLYLALGPNSILLRLIGVAFLVIAVTFLYRTGMLAVIGLPVPG